MNAALDIVEIQNVKSLYCELTDLAATDGAKADPALRAIMTEDITSYFSTMGEFNGRDVLVTHMTTEMVSHIAWSWHAVHTPRIEVSGDTATASWTLLLKVRLKHAPDEIMTMVGRYTDAFRRMPDGWKISAIQWIAEA